MLFVIYNPKAGKGRCIKASEDFLALLRSRHIAFIAKATEYPAHATELALEALTQGYRQFVAIGGDGTMHEVIASLANTDSALCIYPAGSGNDLSRSLSLPGTSQAVLDMLCAGRTTMIDTGVLNGEIFCNVAGFGFDVEVIRQVNRTTKLRGSLAYIACVFRAISQMRFHHVRLQMDDAHWEGEVLLVAVCNGKYFGGGMLVSPQSDVRDEFFHVIVIERVSRWKIPFLLPKFIAGSHLKLPICSTYTCQKLRIDSENEDAFQLDGQLYGATPAECAISSRSLRLFVPESAEFALETGRLELELS